jgi:hypothetical protein
VDSHEGSAGRDKPVRLLVTEVTVHGSEVYALVGRP